jgi:hypothetical protein
LNFIFGIVCLFVCVCAFSLRRESPDMILGDKPLIFEVVLSQPSPEITVRFTGASSQHFTCTDKDNVFESGNFRDGTIRA